MPVDVKKLARHVARTLCFLTALMVVCQADLPFPCSSPGDLGTYFLFPHTHTHCLLLLQLLWERQHALKSQASFPEENLVFSPPSSSRHTPNADKGLTQHIDA